MMFSISCFVDQRHQLCGEIRLGEHKENFPLLVTLWTREDYEFQWHTALRALAQSKVVSCVLITDIQLPEISFGVTYWALFVEGDVVYFQERLARERWNELIGSPASIEKSIPPRIQGTPEEHARVSEWVIPLTDIRTYVKSLA